MEELRTTGETPEHRLKRMTMRSWRRGIKEMDLILGAYADAGLGRLPAEWLDLYDDLLRENDHDLYMWVTGKVPPPDHFAALLDDIARHSNCR